MQPPPASFKKAPNLFNDDEDEYESIKTKP